MGRYGSHQRPSSLVTSGWSYRKMLGAVALLGAGGGAINAWLCFLRIPVPVHDDPGFSWLVVPGGAVHGAVLAIVPVATTLILTRWRVGYRVLVAPAVGWIAGYASWILLHHWVFDSSWSESLVWPRQIDGWLGVVWSPFPYFGTVGAIAYLFLTARGLGRSGAQTAALVACAGALGSLWWWLEFGPWYFALIHGTIWGVLVGWGVSRMGVTRRSHVALANA
jgi:hypothetical protein